MSTLPPLSPDKKPAIVLRSGARGRNPSPDFNGDQFHVNLPALTTAPDRTSDPLLRRAASRTHCITRPERRTPTIHPFESANCNLRWSARLSRETFTTPKGGWIFMAPRRILSHATQRVRFTLYYFIPCDRLESPSPHLASSSADFIFRCPVGPLLHRGWPPVDLDKPV